MIGILRHSRQGLVALFPGPDPDGANHRADKDPSVTMTPCLINVHNSLDNPIDLIITCNENEHSFWQKT
jgi:hypothetical protein